VQWCQQCLTRFLLIQTEHYVLSALEMKPPNTPNQRKYQVLRCFYAVLAAVSPQALCNVPACESFRTLDMKKTQIFREGTRHAAKTMEPRSNSFPSALQQNPGEGATPRPA